MATPSSMRCLSSRDSGNEAWGDCWSNTAPMSRARERRASCTSSATRTRNASTSRAPSKLPELSRLDSASVSQCSVACDEVASVPNPSAMLNETDTSLSLSFGLANGAAAGGGGQRQARRPHHHDTECRDETFVDDGAD